ncbi:MAG: hypothetical protein WBE18_07425 [Gammaproteobacteria bacterium]
MKPKPIGNYETIAKAYAENRDKKPIHKFKQAAPEMFNNITTQPWFLFIRARKKI